MKIDGMETGKSAKAARELLVNQGNLEPKIFLADENTKKISYKNFLDILCCPLCKKDLELTDSHFICNHCKRKFEIIDGIPNFLAEQSEKVK